MANIKITKELICKILEEELLLANPIDEMFESSDMNEEYFTISTKIDGFEAHEWALPIYKRDEKGKVTLVGIRHNK